MANREVDPKPEQTPAEQDAPGQKEHEKNVDRDGGERQPPQHTNDKS